MSSKPSRPLADLVPDCSALHDIAQDAYRRASADPSDKLLTLACFLFVHHLTDWRTKEGGQYAEVSQSPFFQLVREIANGTKHLELLENKYPAPLVSGVALSGGYGMGPYGSGPYGRSSIVVVGRRSSDGAEERHGALAILREALNWWAQHLGKVV